MSKECGAAEMSCCQTSAPTVAVVATLAKATQVLSAMIDRALDSPGSLLDPAAVYKRNLAVSSSPPNIVSALSDQVLRI
jgi:hypothetical protein